MQMKPHAGAYIQRTFKENMIPCLCATTSTVSWKIWEELCLKLSSWSVIYDKSCKLSNITRRPHFADVIGQGVAVYSFLLKIFQFNCEGPCAEELHEEATATQVFRV